MAQRDPLDVDPDEHNENLLRELGYSPQTRPDETLPQVFDRVVDVAQQIDKAREDAADGEQSAASLGPISVESESESGHVWVRVSDVTLTGINLDDHWLSTTDAAEVETEIIATVNDAFKKAQELALAQMMEVQSDFGPMMKNLMDLQADVHRAFVNDLGRATAPLENL